MSKSVCPAHGHVLLPLITEQVKAFAPKYITAEQAEEIIGRKG